MSSDTPSSSASKLSSGLPLPIAMVVITTLLGALILRFVTPMNVVFLPVETVIYTNALAGAAPSSEVQAHAVLASSFPSVCTVQQDSDSIYDNTGEMGPQSERCKAAIDSSAKHPELSYRLLIALDQTPITGTQIRDQAGSLARSDSKDVEGWAHIPGGEIIQPLTRSRLGNYDHLPAGQLSIEQRREIAHSMMGLKAAEPTALADFRQAVSQSVLGGATRYLIGANGALQAAGIAILGIIAITVIRRHSSWRRALAVIVSLCVVMAYVNVDTLEAFSLTHSKSIFGGAEGIESIVGLPFVIAGQVLDFIARSMVTTFAAKTLWTLAYLAVMIGVLTQESIVRALGLVYLSLLLPMWSAGKYELFPYECDALEASVGITLVIWVMNIVCTIAAALTARYLWATYSRSLIAWGTEVFVVKNAPAAHRDD
jgi:hypothetical protein